MDFSKPMEPPANNALVPDIYNKLDAILIEKTKVINSILDIRLGVEQRVLAKYKKKAERLHRTQHEQAVADLSRISQKMPRRLRQRPPESTSNRHRRPQKGYMAEKNEEMICHRCYIHHLPTKKKFYISERLTPSPTVEDDKTHPADGQDKGVTAHVEFREDRSRTSAMMKLPTIRVFAPIERYRFLERDSCGRDKDLNATLTPRLEPYEGWKQVVTNVCNQCKRRVREVPKRSPSQPPLISRETTRARSREKKRGENSRERTSASLGSFGRRRRRLSSEDTSLSSSSGRLGRSSSRSLIPKSTSIRRELSDVARPQYTRESSQTTEERATTIDIKQKASKSPRRKLSKASNIDGGLGGVSEKYGRHSPSKTVAFSRPTTRIPANRE